MVRQLVESLTEVALKLIMHETSIRDLVKKVPVVRFASIAEKSIYWMVPSFLFTATVAAKAPVAGPPTRSKEKTVRLSYFPQCFFGCVQRCLGVDHRDVFLVEDDVVDDAHDPIQRIRSVEQDQGHYTSRSDECRTLKQSETHRLRLNLEDEDNPCRRKCLRRLFAEQHRPGFKRSLGP